MQEQLQKKVLNAFRLVLRPIVKILLRYGIGYNQFAETVKASFVEVSSAEFGIRGRPTNISRIAVMTGLTRKEVRRLRNDLDGGETSIRVKTTPITEIVTRWHTEKEFLDQNGKPSTLSFATGAKSFSNLVKKFGGDVPAGAMRTELKRMGLVRENDDSSLTVLSRAVIAPDSIDKLDAALVHGVYPLLSTIARNTNPDVDANERHAQFSTFSTRIDDSSKERLRRISYDRLSELATSFDDLFTAYESVYDEDIKSEQKPVVMIGLYYFEEQDRKANYEW